MEIKGYNISYIQIQFPLKKQQSRPSDQNDHKMKLATFFFVKERDHVQFPGTKKSKRDRSTRKRASPLSPQIQISHLMFGVVYAPIKAVLCSTNLHLTYRRNELFFWS